VTRRPWGLVLIVFGVVLLIPGLIVFAQTGGGVSPALVLSLVLLLVGGWVRRGWVRSSGSAEGNTPPLPPPPRPDSPEQEER
jgi:hypothetical protein